MVSWVRSRRREWRDHVDRMIQDGITRPDTTEQKIPSRPPKRQLESWTSGALAEIEEEEVFEWPLTARRDDKR